MNKKVEIALKVIGSVAVAGLVVCVGIYAYKHRVVEAKCFPAIATIDAHDYRPPYMTYTTYHDKSGIHRLYINTCNGASALYTKVDGCPEKHFGCALQHIPTESTFRIYFCPNCGRRLMYEDDGSGIGQTFSP